MKAGGWHEICIIGATVICPGKGAGAQTGRKDDTGHVTCSYDFEAKEGE